MTNRFASRGFLGRSLAALRVGGWVVAPALALGGCGQYDLGDIVDALEHDGHGHAGPGGHGGAGGHGGCELDGEHYRAGEIFPSPDGCNTCSCGEDGQVACTLRFCVATCGGITGQTCGEGEYCSFPPEAQCGAGDQTGFCATQPEFCTREFNPVCGCDGVTYGNACEAASSGVSVASEGECGVEEPEVLQLGDSCGGYRAAGSPDCGPGLFCQYQAGAFCGGADFPGECVLVAEVCSDEFDPVCGCDGETYGNACEAAANSASISELGECP